MANLRGCVSFVVHGIVALQEVLRQELARWEGRQRVGGTVVGWAGVLVETGTLLPIIVFLLQHYRGHSVGCITCGITEQTLISVGFFQQTRNLVLVSANQM